MSPVSYKSDVILEKVQTLLDLWLEHSKHQDSLSELACFESAATLANLFAFLHKDFNQTVNQMRFYLEQAHPDLDFLGDRLDAGLYRAARDVSQWGRNVTDVTQKLIAEEEERLADARKPITQQPEPDYGTRLPPPPKLPEGVYPFLKKPQK